VKNTEVHCVCVCVCVCVCENSIMKPTKNCSKGGGRRRLRKRNIYWVNLIKVHYKHIVNITMKSLCMINSC
jgi:hypothetical protein